MKFSQKFLNKLLNSAIKYHNNSIEASELPNKFNNVKDGINILSKALVFEAHHTMKNEIINNNLPILHAINLDGNNPGIISGKSDKDKFLVHKKERKKKKKTQEQIEAKMKKIEERIASNKEKKKIKDEEKEKIKSEKKYIKEGGKDIKKLDKELKKINKKVVKYKEKAALAKKILEKPNPSTTEIKKAKELEEKANEYNNSYEKILNQKNIKTKEIESISNKLKEDKEKKIIEKKKKQEIRKKKQEEKKQIEKKKREEKEEKISQTIDENDMNIYDGLFDLIMEAQGIDDNMDNTLISLDNVKLYPSPLPYQRHIEALTKTNPNPLLIPALLEGKKIKGDAFIKLFYGPPGTGKTYRLMQELLEIVDKKKHKKILVCAPSNIATINMYYRAKKLGLACSLMISNTKMPEDLVDNGINNKIIFSTISMRYGFKLRDVEFTTVIMDEAAQCQEAWFWGLLRYELKYIYLAGDPQQLPALVSDEGVKNKHNRSIMDRLIQLGYPSELLDTQRRMHPDIVKFSNYKYYDNKLKTDYKPFKSKYEAFKIVDIKGNEERIGTSYINKEEAKKVIELYLELAKKFKDVIIISPYQAQCKLLKELNDAVEIHTVDSFQGREADVVILTTVRTTTMGFWYDYRRLNVAMTRAKHVLRIIGNVNCWKSGPLYDLINFNNSSK